MTPRRFLLLLFSVLLVGSLHHHGAAAVPLSYQNTELDFWEPLPFAGGLPIATKPVFWQDSSLYGKILTIGGNIDGSGVFNVTNAVFELDVATERWRQTAPGGDVFMQRTFHVAVVLENNGVQYVAVYGGVTSHPEVAGLPLPIQDFALLNLDTFTWENKGMIVDAEQYYYSFSDRTCCSTCSVAACPLARWSASGVKFDNDQTTMYMYGGINNNDLSFQALQDLWKFNIVTDSWTQMTITNAITPPRTDGAVQALSASAKKRIVVFSGFQPDLASTFVGNDLWMLEEVSTDTWTWTQVMPASFSGPVERASPLSVIVNSFMYVWGGASNNTSVKLAGPMWVLNTTEEDSSLWDWQALDLAPPKFEPVGLSGPGLVYVPTTRTLTSIGGVVTGGSNIAALYRFHPISLLPPLLSVLPDVPNGYDFNLDNDTTHVFNNGSPHFNVLSRQSGASVLTTSFGRLVEVTPGGQQVTSFDLSSTNGFLLLYNIFDPQQGFKVTVFTRHAVPGSGATVSTDAVSVRFEFYQYESDTLTDTLPPGSSLTPQQFLIGGGRLKFNVRINDWPFADPQNRLVLSMGFSFPSPIDLSSQPTSFGTTYNLSCAQGSLSLNLLNNSVNDDVFQPVGNSITLGNNNDASLELTFRSFTNSVFYDPDLGVTVTLSSSGEDDSGGGTETWVIVVAVVVPVVVVVATVILLALISVAAFRRRTTRKRVETLSRVQRAATEEEEEPN